MVVSVGGGIVTLGGGGGGIVTLGGGGGGIVTLGGGGGGIVTLGGGGGGIVTLGGGGGGIVTLGGGGGDIVTLGGGGMVTLGASVSAAEAASFARMKHSSICFVSLSYFVYNFRLSLYTSVSLRFFSAASSRRVSSMHLNAVLCFS